MHWSLDVRFGEDESRIRRGHGAGDFSRLRRFALSRLAREASQKVKSKLCGRDHDNLLKVLTQP